MRLLHSTFAGVPFVAALIANFAQLQQALFDGFAGNTKSILDAELDAAIDSILQEFKSPGGVSVAVIHRDYNNDWKIETKGYGIAKADGTKVTADTLFGIGSNSKLFDILATGLLISNESLSTKIYWDTKIASFVPEWGLMDPVASAESTITDVMSHRTGLPRHDFIWDLSESVPDSIRRLRYLKPSTSFRELHQYNNHMYTVLSYLPPLLTGIPFETYVNEFILAPLGMSSTTYFSGHAAESGNLADGMAREGVNCTEDVFGQGIVHALPFWAPNEGTPGHVLSGPGGMISNAKDMAIWLQALLNDGRHPRTNKTVVPPEILRRVGSGVTINEPIAMFPELSPVVYGGGQRRGSYRGFEFIEHGGSVVGFKSQVTRIPNQNLGIAVLSNDESFGTPIVEAIKFRILDKALKLEAIIDWSARFKSLVTATLTGRVPTPRPNNATLPFLPFNELAGMYHDPGYGTFELCFISTNISLPQSDSCRQLLKELPTTLPDVLDGRIPTFVASWNRVELSHVSLVHFDHNIFNISAFSSIPTGNASGRSYWVSVNSDPSLVAEFAHDGVLGVGIRGVWGAGEGVLSPRGGTVKDRAEVWLARRNAN